MASEVKTDKLSPSTGTALQIGDASDTITIPTGATFTITDGLGVAGGGTGLTSFTAGDVLYATGTTTLAKLAKGTAEQVLAMNSGASAPDWGSVDLTVLPTITVAKGGTNLESFTAGDILYATGSTTLAKLAKGSDDEVLTLASGVPSWAEVAGGISWQSVTTGSTLTAVAGNGYPIDTTSNACTVTLPASASVGDQIIFTDYARNFETNALTIDPNSLNYQGNSSPNPVYDTDGESLHIVYQDTTKGWIPLYDGAVALETPQQGDSLNDEGIIYGGCVGGGSCSRDTSNKISNLGVVASDVTGVGTARQQLGACEYGEDKGIFGGGFIDGGTYTGITNLVGSDGVVASDVTGVMTARRTYMGATFGGDKGIFFGGYNASTSYFDTFNIISNAGVVATDLTAIASVSAKREGVACEYDALFNKATAIIVYGTTAAGTASTSNLVSSAGVISQDVTSISGSARTNAAACDYGGGSGIIGFGTGPVNTSNLITTAGVVGADVTGVGTARYYLTACEFGYTKGIFLAGTDGTYRGVSNLVSDTGVVATDVTAVALARAANPGGCSFN